jgi:hypothetical protein
MRPAHGNARYPPALLRLIMQAGFRWLGLRTYNGLEHINHFVRICQYFLSNMPGTLTGADPVGVGKPEKSTASYRIGRAPTGTATGVTIAASTETRRLKKIITM